MQNYRRAAGFSGMMGQVSNKQSSETPADALADPTSTTSKPASQSASKLPASDLSASEADYLQHLQLEASRTFEELEGEDRIDRSEVIADGEGIRVVVSPPPCDRGDSLRRVVSAQ